MKRIHSLACLIVLALACQLQAGELYRNHEIGFSMDFPEGWTVKGSGVETTVIKGIYRDSESRLIQLTMGCYDLPLAGIAPGHGPLSQKECFHVTSTVFYGGAHNPRLIESGRTTIATYEAEWCLLKANLELETETVPHIGRHYWFVRGDKLFRISAHTGDGKEFLDSMLVNVTNSLATLKFAD